jgi:ankyrin repeat protein
VLACAALSVSTAQAAATLIDAVKDGDRAAIRAILQKKIDVNAASADGTTALHWAAQLNDLETTQLLLKAGANVRAVNRYGMTPLQAAAVNGNPQLLAALLKAGRIRMPCCRKARPC